MTTPFLNLKTDNLKPCKRVRFHPKENPKDVEIHEKCVQVPWELYGKAIPLEYYLQNVMQDARIIQDDHLLNASTNPTDTPGVQNAAWEAWKQKLKYNHNNSRVDKQTKWVMQYVVGHTFARYCLVPENSIGPLERVVDAIEHVNIYMTEHSMTDYKTRDSDCDDFPLNHDLKKFKDTRLAQLTKIKETLESDTGCKRKREPDNFL
jgi:hypothetical protein